MKMLFVSSKFFTRDKDLMSIYVVYSRLKELVEATNGRIVYKGGEFDRSDLFVPPIVADVDESDILMKDEVWISTDFIFSMQRIV